MKQFKCAVQYYGLAVSKLKSEGAEMSNLCCLEIDNKKPSPKLMCLYDEEKLRNRYCYTGAELPRSPCGPY
jgi:hypothetical protein